MAKEKKDISHLERLIGEAIGQERTIGLPHDPAREVWPDLWDWMTRITAGQDYVKQPAKVTLTMGPDGVLITLSDPDLTLSLDCWTPFLGDCLHHLNSVLAGPNPPFKLWGKKQPTLRRKKNKT